MNKFGKEGLSAKNWLLCTLLCVLVVESCLSQFQGPTREAHQQYQVSRLLVFCLNISAIFTYRKFILSRTNTSKNLNSPINGQLNGEDVNFRNLMSSARNELFYCTPTNDTPASATTDGTSAGMDHVPHQRDATLVSNVNSTFYSLCTSCHRDFAKCNAPERPTHFTFGGLLGGVSEFLYPKRSCTRHCFICRQFLQLEALAVIAAAGAAPIIFVSEIYSRQWPTGLGSLSIALWFLRALSDSMLLVTVAMSSDASTNIFASVGISRACTYEGPTGHVVYLRNLEKIILCETLCFDGLVYSPHQENGLSAQLFTYAGNGKFSKYDVNKNAIEKTHAAYLQNAALETMGTTAALLKDVMTSDYRYFLSDFCEIASSLLENSKVGVWRKNRTAAHLTSTSNENIGIALECTLTAPSKIRYIFACGTVDGLLLRSTRVMLESGVVVLKDIIALDEITRKFKNLSGRSRCPSRSIGFAFKPMRHGEAGSCALDDLTFLGFLSAEFNVLPPIVEAIKDVSAAGIRAVVLTRESIANLGNARVIVQAFPQPTTRTVFSQYALDHMSEEGKLKAVSTGYLFADMRRDCAESVVELLQAQGQVCIVRGHDCLTQHGDEYDLRMCCNFLPMRVKGTNTIHDATRLILDCRDRYTQGLSLSLPFFIFLFSSVTICVTVRFWYGNANAALTLFQIFSVHCAINCSRAGLAIFRATLRLNDGKLAFLAPSPHIRRVQRFSRLYIVIMTLYVTGAVLAGFRLSQSADKVQQATNTTHSSQKSSVPFLIFLVSVAALDAFSFCGMTALLPTLCLERVLHTFALFVTSTGFGVLLTDSVALWGIMRPVEHRLVAVSCIPVLFLDQLSKLLFKLRAA